MHPVSEMAETAQTLPPAQTPKVPADMAVSWTWTLGYVDHPFVPIGKYAKIIWVQVFFWAHFERLLGGSRYVYCIDILSMLDV